MITEYHRPQTLAEALQLLQNPQTWPLGGGAVLSRHQGEAIAVVDLQALGLDAIQSRGDQLQIGATVTLQALLDHPQTPPALKAALRLEAPRNLRQQSTLGGLLVSGDGRSPALAALLALDAALTVATLGADGQPSTREERLGEWLPLRDEARRGVLITGVQISLKPALAFHHVGRTPSDRPLLLVALARWPSGRTRAVAGGWGSLPVLAMDGKDSANAPVALQNICREAADERASAEYRMEVAAVLAARCLQDLDA